MKKIKIISIVGARPNFVKIAPLAREIKKFKDIDNILVHTGQHYSDYMSDIFFRDFKLSKYINLNIGPLPRDQQIRKIMEKLNNVFLRESPDLVVVVGDVNSTLAAALAAVRLNLKVAHIEAGLRSFDWNMPEEINRAFTDAVGDFLFITEPSGLENLDNEGVEKKKVFFVGNIMIDSLIFCLKEARKRKIIQELGLKKGQYAIITLHRPSNVDARGQLKKIINVLAKISKNIKIIYPVHPRSYKMLKSFGYLKKLKSNPNILLVSPLGYIDFLKLVTGSKFILTDSGGIQEETTYLGIPCFTLRNNTERPLTVTQGTNIVVGKNYARLLKLINNLPLRRKPKRPKLWDGKTAVRIVKIIRKEFLEKINARRFRK